MPLPTIPSGNVFSSLPTGFNVANSCRFNDGDNAYMHKTPSGAGNQDVWTFSTWFKRSGLAKEQALFVAGSDSSNATLIWFRNDDILEFSIYNSGTRNGRVQTSVKYRDVSAWYHLVVSYNSADGSATDRMKIYINGARVTDVATPTNPSSGQDSLVNHTSKHSVGSDGAIGFITGAGDFDGYMAETVLLDGTAATPTSFGEYDEDSPTIWKPIDVSGLTFGTNGFYLDYEDSANLGNDANGGTDFTEVNLAAADQATDTPTNNFCTMNPLDNFYKAATFSEGNCLTVGGASSKNSWITSTFALSKGKWYCEFVVPDVATDHTNVSFGISDRVTIASATALGNTADFAQCGLRMHNGHKRLNGTSSSYGNSYSVGQVIGMALNLDDNELKYYINNTVQNSGTAISITAVASTVNGYYFIACGDESDVNGTLAFNFGGCSGFAVSSAESDADGYGAFEYAPPTGYFAICSKNLAEYG